MSDDNRAVFISYAWGGESEEIVNQIDTSLQKRGIKIVRDKRDLGYKGSIHEFMERIGQGNCVIVVISDEYLRSPKCMFELIEISEENQFIDRIFPIFLPNAFINDTLERIEYVQYWEDKRGKLAEKIKTLDPANLQGIREEMDLYDRIRDKISGIVSILKDMNTLTPDMHKASDFSDLYNAIETRMKEGSAITGNGNQITHILSPDGINVNSIPSSNQPLYSMRDSPVSGIPSDPPLFLDRAEALDAIKASFPTARSISIFGEKGIGKTSFVRYLIHHADLPILPKTVLYVDASERGLDDLLQKLFDRFCESQTEIKPREAELLEALQQAEALIFIDHLTLGQKETISLRNSLPRCKFILASMEPAQECQKVYLKGLPDEDAVALFKEELASFVHVNHSLNKEEQAVVEKLCALYQGNPLRIVEAADRVAQGKMSVFQLLEESEQADPDTVLLQAALSSLTEKQKQILLILAAVGGSKLPQEHLMMLLPDPDFLDSLQELIRGRLIQDDGSRYSLTGNLASSLAATEDLSAWEARLLEHFIHWLEGKPSLARVEESMGALLYLLKKANEKQKWSSLILFGRALEPGLILGKRWQAWEELLNRILDAAKALGDRKVEAWVLHQQGSRAMYLGQDDQARDLLTEALSIRKEINDIGGLQVTQHNLDALRIPVPATGGGSIGGGSTGGGIAGTLALAAILLALIWLLGRGLPSVPGITATSAGTNTFIAAASSTPTRIPTITSTLSRTPTSTPRNTPSATTTPSPTAVIFSFGTPQLSTNQLFFQGESCRPNNITIRVSAQNSSAIKVLFFSRKLRDIDTGEDITPLFSSVDAMNPEGSGIYTLDVTGDELIGDSGITEPVRVVYQFSIQPIEAPTPHNSAVYSDLLLLPCPPIPTPVYAVIETLTVPVGPGIEVTSNTLLEQGILYTIRASGTASVGGRQADPEYVDSQDHCALSQDGYYVGPLDVGIGINKVDNHLEKFPPWGDFNSDHVYTINLTGQGKRITFRYLDCYYNNNNSGNLMIEIYGPSR